MPRSRRIVSASGVVGPFGRLDDDLALQAARVLDGDLLLARGRDDDLARHLEDVRRADLAGVGVAGERAVLGAPAGHRRDVEAVGIDEPGLGVGHRDDARADRIELGGGDRADVAEALDRDARLADVHADALADGLGHVDDAQAGGLAAPRRAAEHDRLARDDLEDRVAHHLRVRVHEPRHLALARAHIRRRDVAIGADDGDQLGGVAAREALELADAQVVRRSSARRPSRRRRAGPSSAHFHVIHIASAAHSPSETSAP